MRLWSYLFIAAAAWGQIPIIVDTDAGTDDVIALLWLFRQPSIRIEAITICNGLAHPAAGAETVLRLLDAAGKNAIPVYVGASKPYRGSAAFPDEWRKSSDRLLRDELPAPRRKPSAAHAARFLADRLMDARLPVRILALGPLTNFAMAVAIEPRTGAAVRDLTWMGGAVGVAGNVDKVKTAEWNAHADAEAAERVFGLGWRIRIVPLDATNQAPIGVGVVKLFEEEAREWDASLVLKLLRAEAASIKAGRYFAWDPLAAMAMADPLIVSFQPMALAVRRRPAERGRLVRVLDARPNVFVGQPVDRKKFATALRSLLP